MISTAVIMSALELGCIYALVALALFLSFRILNIADMTTDGAFTLGCAVSATIAVVDTLCWRFPPPWPRAPAPDSSRPFCRRS